VVSRDVVFDESWTSWKDGEPIKHDTDAIIQGQPLPKTPTAAQPDEESSGESSSESDDEESISHNSKTAPSLSLKYS
jgi:hypothetical protein